MISKEEIKQLALKGWNFAASYINKETFSHLFLKRHIIGLVIGASSAKVAKFRKKGKGLEFVDSRAKEIDYTDNESMLETRQVAALKDILKEISPKDSDVVAIINCPMTTVKSMTMPIMSGKELLGAIKLQSKNYFHARPGEDLLFDYKILDEVYDKGIKKYRLAVAASPRATVNRHLSILQRTGVHPSSFVPGTWRLLSVAGSVSRRDDKTRCFIDMGELTTEIVIANNCEVLFTRKFPLGGIDISRAMMSRLASKRGEVQLSFKEAEEIKRRIGVPGEGAEEMVDDKISTSQILSMLRAPLEKISREINNSFHYYSDEMLGAPIDGGVLLYGEAAEIKGLSEYLSGKLGLEVSHGVNGEEKAGAGPGALSCDRPAGKWEREVGSVLEGNLRNENMNLLPPEVKIRAKKTSQALLVGAASGCVFGLILLMFLILWMQFGSLDRRISAANREIKAIQPSLQKAERRYLGSMVLVNEPFWEDVFRELSNIIPSEITLTSLDLNDKVLTLKGNVASRSGEEALSDFIEALQKGLFNNVRLVEAKDLGTTATSYFEIRCRTKGDSAER